MQAVAVYDAKTRLSELLDAVQAGEEVTITRRGVPVARLVAAHAKPGRKRVVDEAAARRERIAKAVREMHELTRHIELPEGMTLRQTIEDGRD